MKRIGQALSILAVSLIVLAAALPAHAYIYAGKRKKISCGVVLLNNGEDLDPVAHTIDCNGLPYRTVGANSFRDYAYSLFSVLEMRLDLKPLGWSLQNPHSSGGLYGGAGNNAEDKPENRPEYWFVNLHTFKDLTDMQVLYLPAAGNVKLKDEDCQKLRQFVDSGGVLWIDNCGTGGNALDFGGSFFIQNFSFRQTSGGPEVAVSRHHPLLTVPFWISESEIAALGLNPGQSYCIPGYDVGGTGGWAAQKDAPLTFDILYPITNNASANKPSVAANAFGSGRIVASSDAIGQGCMMTYPFNQPSLKFAYNVLAWSASWTHLRKDPRHSGHSIDTVGGTKLVKSWMLPASSNSGTENAPIIYKNVVFYTAGSTLFALDLVPDEDLDQDGNPDDGEPKQLTTPPGVDIIWKWDAPKGATLSAPTLVTAQDPSNPGGSIEAIGVMSSIGVVYMLKAFPTLAGNDNVLSGTPEPAMPEWPVGGPISSPYPPLYINGWIYAIGGDGLLHAYNPSLAAWKAISNTAVNDTWFVPNQPDTTCIPKAGPTFGYVSNESNGALIGMIYWAGTRWSNGAQVTCDWVYGAPVCVSNDNLRVERTSTTGVYAECRIALSRVAVAPSPKPVVRITYTDSNGNDVDIPVVGSPFVNRKLNATGDAPDMSLQAPNYITVQAQSPIPSGAHIIATYAVDYSAGLVPLLPQAPIQKWLEPMSSDLAGQPPGTTIIGTPALGSGNMIYACGQRTTGRTLGSVYGMKNDGTAQYCKWNYELHDGIAGDKIISGSPIDMPPVIFAQGRDASGQLTILGLNEPKVYGSPAVAGNKVIVAVTGTPDTSLPDRPSAAIVCFKANPEFVIRVTEAAGLSGGNRVPRAKSLKDATGRELSVKIWQPDLTSTGAIGAPPPVGASAVTKNLGMIDYDKGTITFDTFERPKLTGFGVAQTNTFGPSLPVWVYVENMEVPIDYSTWGPAVRYRQMEQSVAAAKAEAPPPDLPKPTGDAVDLSQWNNLLWYYVVPPHDEGPCTGIHSSPVVIGNTIYFVCDDGYMFAIPTESDENSGGQMKADQLIWSEKVCGAMGESNTSIAGSNGVLLVPGSDGLYAYTNATTLISDSGRVMEVDGSGEATWSVDTITWPASAPPDASTYPPRMSGPVNQPAKAKYAGPGEVLIVNTGANQVCKIDKAGSVGLESIPNTTTNAPQQFIRWVWDKFTDPRHLLRPGQPTELRTPTDATYWREWENGNLVIHCLVADSGNHRVVDLVYRLGYSNQKPVGLLADAEDQDPATRLYLPQLNWVSVTDSMNEQYGYDCIQLVPNPTPSAGQFIWAAVSNYRTGTSANAGAAAGKGLGGAIVALKYRVPISGGWNYAADKSGEIVAACDKADWGGTTPRPLAQPKYFQVIDRTLGRYILICDNYGVYEIGPLPTTGNTSPKVARALEDLTYRKLPREVIKDCDKTLSRLPPVGSTPPPDYRPLDGVPLQACCVQELPNGNWLITNNYAGASPIGSKRFKGEVFELSWGTGDPKIEWSSPAIYCDCNPDGTPVPGSWWQGSKTTYVLQQPTSALRQF